MTIEDFRTNPRTAVLAAGVDRLAKKVEELRALAAVDASVGTLAEQEIKDLETTQADLFEQMETIAASRSAPVETAAPAVILEIRAGAGGEEAALFAVRLAA